MFDCCLSMSMSSESPCQDSMLLTNILLDYKHKKWQKLRPKEHIIALPLPQPSYCYSSPTATALLLLQLSYCHSPPTATALPLPQPSYCYSSPTATALLLLQLSHCHSPTVTALLLPQPSYCYSSHTATSLAIIQTVLQLSLNISKNKFWCINEYATLMLSIICWTFQGT